MASDEDPDGLVGKVVTHTLANQEIGSIKEYLDRGREFKDCTLEELKVLYASSCEVWAKDVPNIHARDRFNDVHSEFLLRDIEPPSELIEEPMKKVTEYIKERVSVLSEDQIDEIGGEILDDYLDSTKSRN